ncbi:MAG: sensor histidine kinase, partial [Candidatus Odinarchaeota archaeon]
MILCVTIIFFFQVFIALPLTIGISPSLLVNIRYIDNVLALLAFLIIYFLSRTRHYYSAIGFGVITVAVYCYIVLDPLLSPFDTVTSRLTVYFFVFVAALLLASVFLPVMYSFLVGLTGMAVLLAYYLANITSLAEMPGLDTIQIYLTTILALVLIHSILRQRYQKELVLQNTSLKLINQELEDQKVKAQAATAAKNEFLAKMSHEIRTPLNLLIGATYVLDSESGDEEKHKYLQVLRRESHILLNLVNDVLDLSKIEAGKLQLRTVEFDFISLIKETTASFDQFAKDKGISLELEIGKSVAKHYEGDRDRLSQILRNLVDNAIKFTSDGYVRVKIDQDKTMKHVKLVVSDTGQGMTLEELDKAF